MPSSMPFYFGSPSIALVSIGRNTGVMLPTY